ncbi:Mediator of RNA polymerase II transcription subunit 31 [Recurvomyces mirabilis]|nr:Mediator of RNA polymerase II transcription subunit 31 [Recurvomyces mirabilis]
MAEAKVNGTKSRDVNWFAGHQRFDIECEFVQSLSNPHYILHLAANKYFDDPTFVAYLKYLEYFRQPEYIKYLLYPGPTLRALELLQQEQFRKDALNPALIEQMLQEGMEAAATGPR